MTSHSDVIGGEVGGFKQAKSSSEPKDTKSLPAMPSKRRVEMVFAEEKVKVTATLPDLSLKDKLKIVYVILFDKRLIVVKPGRSQDQGNDLRLDDSRPSDGRNTSPSKSARAGISKEGGNI